MNSCCVTMVLPSWNFNCRFYVLIFYVEFGVYVDKHGDPNRPSGTIEWEGTADRVALHAPYVLLFDTRFIEIRYLETGRLAQIIPGTDIRCTWDGRGISSLNAPSPSAQTMSFPAPDGRDEPLNQDAQVHAIMNATDVAGGSRTRAVAQQLFELLPTVPLFLPEPSQEIAGNHSSSSGSYSAGTSAAGSYSASGSSPAGPSGSRLSVGQSNGSPASHSPQLRSSPSRS